MESHCTVCGAPRPLGQLDAPGDEGCPLCGGLRGMSAGSAGDIHPALRHKVSHEPPGAPGLHPAPLAEEPPAAPTEAPPVPEPREPGWKVERQGDTLRVSWRGSSRGLVVLALFSLLVGGGLVALFLGPALPFGADALALVAALVLLGMGYWMLAKAMNRTYLEASRRTGIRVWHGPLPWFSTVKGRVAPGAIRQLYGFRRSQGASSQGRRSHPRAKHELRVLKADDTSVTLVSSGLTLQQVHFLERALEAHLGIHHESQLPEGPSA